MLSISDKESQYCLCSRFPSPHWLQFSTEWILQSQLQLRSITLQEPDHESSISQVHRSWSSATARSEQLWSENLHSSSGSKSCRSILSTSWWWDTTKEDIISSTQLRINNRRGEWSQLNLRQGTWQQHLYCIGWSFQWYIWQSGWRWESKQSKWCYDW